MMSETSSPYNLSPGAYNKNPDSIGIKRRKHGSLAVIDESTGQVKFLQQAHVTYMSTMAEKVNIGRRRTLTRIVAGNLMGHPRKQNIDTSKFASDTTSDNLNRSNISNTNVKLENTYRIEPSDQERFESTKVEKVMRDVLESRLQEMEYDREPCIQISKELVSEIRHRIKIFQWKRYRIVCHVTIGQNTRQGVQVVSRCVWDDKLDNYACVRYNNKSLFAVAQCYGVYFE